MCSGKSISQTFAQTFYIGFHLKEFSIKMDYTDEGRFGMEIKIRTRDYIL